MTKLESLRELERRLDEAKGPLHMQDRAALLYLTHCKKGCENVPYKWSVGCGDSGEDELEITGQGLVDDLSVSALRGFPDTSIDAALTLVPEGRPWTVSGGMESVVSATVGCIAPDAKAKTPALALCLAAVRALIHIEDTRQ